MTPGLRGRLTRLGLGGHEFLPDGSARGFNEDFRRATTAGYVWPGFGGPARRAVVAAAVAEGINLFDATIDAEKDALGRNLAAVAPPQAVYIQTRPEGMVYENNPNDPFNTGLADWTRLRAEVERIRGLLRRPCVDVLNLGFRRAALEHDPEFLAKVADNIARLKTEGLIRWASADTFSGEALYLEAIATGAFDSLFINFNVADEAPARAVLPAAAAAGMAVHVREAFGKGALFRLAADAGIMDRAAVARAAVRWILSHAEISTLVVGAGTSAELANAVRAANAPEPDADDRALLDRLRASPGFRDLATRKSRDFAAGWQ